MQRWAQFGILSWSLLNFAAGTRADELRVEPYLQKVTTTSVEIRWEASASGDAIVEWGTTRQLGMRATATQAERERDDAVLNVVALRGLTPSKRYFYRVRSGSVQSDIYDLRTLPGPDHATFLRMIVMSDMQRDGSHPHIFRDVVRNGLLPLFAESARANGQAPALALLPGDLVRHGKEYEVWSEEFFRPLRPVAPYLPLFPVAGNHDEDSRHYFRYFGLPENGSPKHKERWWWADFANVRVIGLDSNVGYRDSAQLSWLDATLRATCGDPHVDFVFAAHHHPEKSELWPKGELPYSAYVTRAIERFASRCNKPSVIFTGHTHAYSRGHSRDHPVTFMGVASAGGNLDRVGEYAGRDYAEYVTSQDDYGYVIADTHGGERPWFRLQRISLGRSEQPRTRTMRDELVVRRDNEPPRAPELRWPRKESVDPKQLVLTTSAFSDPDGDGQAAVHFQVSRDCSFARVEVDRWHQLGDDAAGRARKTREIGPSYLRLPTLAWNTQYCYRARVRDRSLAWSPWSAPQHFRTQQVPLEQVAEHSTPRMF